MKNFKYVWVVGLIVTLLIIIVPIFLFASGEAEAVDEPWTSVPERPPQTDHSELMKGPYETGQDVTDACLECHEDAGHEMIQTVHWKWEGDPVLLPGRDEPVTIGKKNQINNFCIGTYIELLFIRLFISTYFHTANPVAASMLIFRAFSKVKFLNLRIRKTLFLCQAIICEYSVRKFISIVRKLVFCKSMINRKLDDKSTDNHKNYTQNKQP